MGHWRERLQNESGTAVAVDWIAAHYHYVSLAILVLFALYTRVLDWAAFVSQDTVFYTGNDPYYHLRMVQYTVRHFPSTMPFDPWTNFALGTSNAQFGTLFDQLIAGAALVVGLGSPDEHLVRLVTLFAPAVFGTITLLPAYVIGRRLGGRFAGVVSAGVVTFATGGLFVQGFVGTADHHVAEALFQAIGVLGMMVAVAAAQREKPVFELFAEGAINTARATVGWSLLAGVAVGMYLLVWPPGVLLLGIFAVFFFVYLSVIFLLGRSPEPVAIGGAIAMTVTAVIALSTTTTLTIDATARSLLQPGLALAVALECITMAWLARMWENLPLPRIAYPATIAGGGIAIVGALAVFLPTVYGFFLNNVLRVIGLGLSRSQTAATVGEISPLPLSQLTAFYKLTVFVAGGGVIIAVIRQVTQDEPSAEELLVVVWFIFTLLATLTQRRFGYYLTLPLASLVALLVGSVLTTVTRASTRDGIEFYQVVTVGTILLVVIMPMAVFSPTVLGVASTKGPGAVRGWQPSLEYLKNQTPAPGTYATPGGQQMDYFGTFTRTDNFDYPSGAYGVLSWWDYGHWITTNGQRIPVANPFQQGSDVAARFLLAQNGSQAAASLAQRDENDAKTRLVMIDWKMAETATAVGGKFFAPPAFKAGVNRSTFYSRIVDRQRLQAGAGLVGATKLIRKKQPYYRSMIARLYHYHGSAKRPAPVVVEWQGRERRLPSGGAFTLAPDAANGSSPVLTRFPNLSAARQYVSRAPNRRQLGGIGVYPSESVSALEHYRLVHVSPVSALQSGQYRSARMRTISRTNLRTVLGNNVTRRQALAWLIGSTTPSWTKTFERVPGATITGSGPTNTTIRASVRLSPNAGSVFTYTQRTRTNENGSFELTVPYATTGYTKWGVADGYVNSSVRALGPYNITTARTFRNGTASRWFGQVQVTEGQVLGENETASRVVLKQQTSSLSAP